MQGNVEKEYAIYNAILKPYIGEDLIVNKKYRSPIISRRDSTPSFSVKEINKTLRWKDYGFSDATGDKIQNLIMHLHDPPLSFREACDIIEAGDFPVIPYKAKKESEYKVKYGSLDFTELSWFSDYHISPRTLKRFKTFGLRYMWKDGRVVYNYERDPMAFLYLGESRDHWQAYFPRPFHTRPKFHRNGLWIIGWEQLPLTGKTVRFMSSAKDGMVAYEASGVHPLAGNGETDFMTFKRVLLELKLRFRHQDILMDPDKAGKAAERKLAEALQIPIFPFPYINNKDDLADTSKKMGINFIRQGLTY